MTDRTSAGQIGFNNILVTGADGFVGRHFVPALRRQLGPDARLCLASRRGVTVDGRPIANRFDLEAPATVSALVQARAPDLVVHLAGQPAVNPSSGGGRTTWAVNFGGSYALAAAIADYSPNCTVLFISSAQVYGRAFENGPADEATVLEPITAYARSKAAAEAMFDDVLPPERRLIVLRPSNHIGPGQGVDFAAPAFAEQIARLERSGGGEISVGNLESERDFLSVRDVVDAYLAILGRAADLPRRAVFNVASGQVIRTGEVLRRLLAASATDIRVVVDPERMRPSDIRRTDVDASRLRVAIGWRPEHDLDQTLAEVLDDFRRRLDRG